MTRTGKSRKMAVLNSVGSLSLLSAVVYMLFTSLNLPGLIISGIALSVVATPVIMQSDGVIEILVGLFEALFEGAMTIVEGIFSIISTLFNW
ncbi:hypothetical protein B0H98_11113 [Vreelandella songnenensis]|uniref:Uncharacterized protein n=1 Tax=Vreelandella songnenensis TaxID=1176243 RepID=A0A2T0UUM4_9GAMM|nr:hypothetical protein [Halomonas songnenensis]PRY61613.1 hypothetical protein B0H98_11113 [Halomonas songnenensis]